jgi:hypothetical protein
VKYWVGRSIPGSDMGNNMMLDWSRLQRILARSNVPVDLEILSVSVCRCPCGGLTSSLVRK